MCLNGEWEFEIDSGDSGMERGLLEREFNGRIVVPFCPESMLSGIGETDFMNAVWYRRTVIVPSDWAGRRILLHFQAVDYEATVWANGIEAGRHRGGWCGFTCDVTGLAAPGEEATIVVRARDDHRQPKPRGKQSPGYRNRGCLYTRTTGIWQTVWMEPVPETHLKRPRITPDVANGLISLIQPIVGRRSGGSLRATLKDAEGEVSAATVPVGPDFTPSLDLPVKEDRRRLWQPGEPHLYDVEIELLDEGGGVIDRASSYTALRSVTIDGKAVKISGRTVFQRLVLDQGYYPDGILTAPSDEALVKDITLSMAAGFNGARLHQKVFEERFLYHADRLGYLVWGEFGDWGIDRGSPGATCVAQWLEVLDRDYSHPCIIGWCPLNETGPGGGSFEGLDDLTRGLFLAAKATDSTRPVLDASGHSHRLPETDIYDCHDYDQNPETFRERHGGLGAGKPFVNRPHGRDVSVPYGGQPFFVSEFGGIWWNEEAPGAGATGGDADSWGYGERVGDIEDFYARFEGLCNALLDDPHMFGYCYTQLTDVFQEQNGIYAFDRREKFDTSRIAAIQTRPAAIEQAASGGA